MTPEQYRKTWYWKFTFGHAGSPEKWISGTPVKFRGFYIGTWWKIAKKGYPWSNANKYSSLE